MHPVSTNLKDVLADVSETFFALHRKYGDVSAEFDGIIIRHTVIGIDEHPKAQAAYIPPHLREGYKEQGTSHEEQPKAAAYVPPHRREGYQGESHEERPKAAAYVPPHRRSGNQ